VISRFLQAGALILGNAVANRASIICVVCLAAVGATAPGCGSTTSGSTSAPAAAVSSNSSQGTSTDVSAAKKPFNLASTLDGKTVLPHRIRWVALPALPAPRVREVDFLIDGRRTWVERKPPYTYAEDGGFLVTSWLAPGKHRFTVDAIPQHGVPATDTVVARVLPPPEVPPTLAGTWQRRITNTSGAPAPGSAGNPTSTLTPPGKYTITFDHRWIRDVFPCTNTPCRYVSATGAGTEFLSDWNPGPTTFYVQGEVTFRVFKDTDRLAGWWCQTWGPPATYTWSVTGNTLKLAPVGGHDACPIRGFVWSGIWKRSG
jgi:hypothetical protein